MSEIKYNNYLESLISIEKAQEVFEKRVQEINTSRRLQNVNKTLS